MPNPQDFKYQSFDTLSLNKTPEITDLELEMKIEELEMHLLDLNFPRSRIDVIKQEAYTHNTVDSGLSIEPAIIIAQGKANRGFPKPVCFISPNGIKKEKVLEPFTEYLEGDYLEARFRIEQEFVGKKVCFSFEGKKLIVKNIKLTNHRVILVDI